MERKKRTNTTSNQNFITSTRNDKRLSISKNTQLENQSQQRPVQYDNSPFIDLSVWGDESSQYKKYSTLVHKDSQYMAIFNETNSPVISAKETLKRNKRVIPEFKEMDINQLGLNSKRNSTLNQVMMSLLNQNVEIQSRTQEINHVFQREFENNMVSYHPKMVPFTMPTNQSTKAPFAKLNAEGDELPEYLVFNTKLPIPLLNKYFDFGFPITAIYVDINKPTEYQILVKVHYHPELKTNPKLIGHKINQQKTLKAYVKILNFMLGNQPLPDQRIQKNPYSKVMGEKFLFSPFELFTKQSSKKRNTIQLVQNTNTFRTKNNIASYLFDDLINDQLKLWTNFTNYYQYCQEINNMATILAGKKDENELNKNERKILRQLKKVLSINSLSELNKQKENSEEFQSAIPKNLYQFIKNQSEVEKLPSDEYKLSDMLCDPLFKRENLKEDLKFKEIKKENYSTQEIYTSSQTENKDNENTNLNNVNKNEQSNSNANAIQKETDTPKTNSQLKDHKLVSSDFVENSYISQINQQWIPIITNDKGMQKHNNKNDLNITFQQLVLPNIANIDNKKVSNQRLSDVYHVLNKTPKDFHRFNTNLHDSGNLYGSLTNTEFTQKVYPEETLQKVKNNDFDSLTYKEFKIISHNLLEHYFDLFFHGKNHKHEENRLQLFFNEYLKTEKDVKRSMLKEKVNTESGKTLLKLLTSYIATYGANQYRAMYFQTKNIYVAQSELQTLMLKELDRVKLLARKLLHQKFKSKSFDEELNYAVGRLPASMPEKEVNNFISDYIQTNLKSDNYHYMAQAAYAHVEKSTYDIAKKIIMDCEHIYGSAALSTTIHQQRIDDIRSTFSQDTRKSLDPLALKISLEYNNLYCKQKIQEKNQERSDSYYLRLKQCCLDTEFLRLFVFNNSNNSKYKLDEFIKLMGLNISAKTALNYIRTLRMYFGISDKQYYVNDFKENGLEILSQNLTTEMTKFLLLDEQGFLNNKWLKEIYKKTQDFYSVYWDRNNQSFTFTISYNQGKQYLKFFEKYLELTKWDAQYRLEKAKQLELIASDRDVKSNLLEKFITDKTGQVIYGQLVKIYRAQAKTMANDRAQVDWITPFQETKIIYEMLKNNPYLSNEDIADIVKHYDNLILHPKKKLSLKDFFYQYENTPVSTKKNKMAQLIISNFKPTENTQIYQYAKHFAYISKLYFFSSDKDLNLNHYENNIEYITIDTIDAHYKLSKHLSNLVKHHAILQANQVKHKLGVEIACENHRKEISNPLWENLSKNIFDLHKLKENYGDKLSINIKEQQYSRVLLNSINLPNCLEYLFNELCENLNKLTESYLLGKLSANAFKKHPLYLLANEFNREYKSDKNYKNDAELKEKHTKIMEYLHQMVKTFIFRRYFDVDDYALKNRSKKEKQYHSYKRRQHTKVIVGEALYDNFIISRSLLNVDDLSIKNVPKNKINNLFNENTKVFALIQFFKEIAKDLCLSESEVTETILRDSYYCIKMAYNYDLSINPNFNKENYVNELKSAHDIICDMEDEEDDNDVIIDPIDIKLLQEIPYWRKAALSLSRDETNIMNEVKALNLTPERLIQLVQQNYIPRSSVYKYNEPACNHLYNSTEILNSGSIEFQNPSIVSPSLYFFTKLNFKVSQNKRVAYYEFTQAKLHKESHKDLRKKLIETINDNTITIDCNSNIGTHPDTDSHTESVDNLLSSKYIYNNGSFKRKELHHLLMNINNVHLDNTDPIFDILHETDEETSSIGSTLSTTLHEDFMNEDFNSAKQKETIVYDDVESLTIETSSIKVSKLAKKYGMNEYDLKRITEELRRIDEKAIYHANEHFYQCKRKIEELSDKSKMVSNIFNKIQPTFNRHHDELKIKSPPIYHNNFKPDLVKIKVSEPNIANPH